jgi:hypothetical protein
MQSGGIQRPCVDKMENGRLIFQSAVGAGSGTRTHTDFSTGT